MESWRRCSACKKDIPLGGVYFVCSVSTCNRKRTALAFCSVSCWEVHLPTERHREAWAIEERAPREPESITAATARVSKGQSTKQGRGEVLVVASKLKAYIRAESGYNTSDSVLSVLSTSLRKICDESIANARRAERTTVIDRDVPHD